MKNPRFLALISTLVLLPFLGMAAPVSAEPTTSGSTVGMVMSRPLPANTATVNPNEQPLLMQISAQPGGTVVPARTSSSIVELDPVNCGSSTAILKDPKHQLGCEDHKETLVEKIRVGVQW